MKIGGQIPWNAYTYLRKFKISSLMGRPHMKDVLGNHLKDRSFRLVHWLSITLFLRKTSQESINLERKSYLDCSLDTLCTRVGIWKGDILVADIEELETMDASEIYSKRLNAKEAIFPKEKNLFFQPQMDESHFLEEIRTENIHLDTGTSNSRRRSRRFLGESEGSLPQPHDSFPDAGEAMNDFWSMSGNFIYRHHVEPRVKLYSPREESFPIPLKCIDVSRTTHTNLDVMQERRIDDYWNKDGSRDLSDSWTGFTQFTLSSEKPPEGFLWSGERLTKRQATSRPDHLWPELWRGLARNAKLREKHRNGQLKNQSSIMPEDYEESISLTLRTRNSKKPLGMLARNWKRQWLLLCLARQARHVSMELDPW